MMRWVDYKKPLTNIGYIVLMQRFSAKNELKDVRKEMK
jgi:hypothetical protein